MPMRLVFYACFCLLLTACSVGTVSVKNFSDMDIAASRLYAWRGIGTARSGDTKSQDLSIVDVVEQNIERILDDRDYRQVAGSDAQIELSIHLQLQNALAVEQQYRKRMQGVFRDNHPGSVVGDGNVLLPDVDPPLYTGQQRGTIELTVFGAGTDQVLRLGYATVVFPENIENPKQLAHLDRTLRRLVDKVLR